MTDTVMDLAAMAAEVRAINIEKGWRDAGLTFGDRVALIHSELSEALEAFRDHGLADATGVQMTPIYADEEDHMGNVPVVDWAPPKPEGVGSELADVLIRLVDTCDAHGLGLEGPPPAAIYSAGYEPLPEGQTFGERITHLHRRVAVDLGAAEQAMIDGWRTTANDLASFVYRELARTCIAYGIDLDAEYRRKVAYNRTRPYRHGGRAL